ncbi:MAG: hypothetical protein JWP81_3422 [Ferruginibacter sp.]|nr:hypothetical protein [Ferruginibacter sp.]
MIYLIYDTALNGPYTFMLLQQAYPVYQSMFKGTKDEALSDVAPYLFEIDELLFEKVTGPLVSLKAILVMQSGDSMEKLCLHFKNFIYQTINGRENYLRFWDARVLNKILPEWTPEKTQDFFEDILSFSFINEEDDTAVRLIMLHGKLQKMKIHRNELFGSPIATGEPNQQSVKAEVEDKMNVQKPRPTRRFFYE